MAFCKLDIRPFDFQSGELCPGEAESIQDDMVAFGNYHDMSQAMSEVKCSDRKIMTRHSLTMTSARER
jgi:hypothetical protein